MSLILVSAEFAHIYIFVCDSSPMQSMMRGRSGVTSYVGYGALTLILMYVLFLYNATKTSLQSAEGQVTQLTNEKQEMLSQLSGKWIT